MDCFDRKPIDRVFMLYTRSGEPRRYTLDPTCYVRMDVGDYLKSSQLEFTATEAGLYQFRLWDLGHGAYRPEFHFCKYGNVYGRTGIWRKVRVGLS